MDEKKTLMKTTILRKSKMVLAWNTVNLCYHWRGYPVPKQTKKLTFRRETTGNAPIDVGGWGGEVGELKRRTVFRISFFGRRRNFSIFPAWSKTGWWGGGVAIHIVSAHFWWFDPFQVQTGATLVISLTMKWAQEGVAWHISGTALIKNPMTGQFNRGSHALLTCQVLGQFLNITLTTIRWCISQF